MKWEPGLHLQGQPHSLVAAVISVMTHLHFLHDNELKELQRQNEGGG